MVSPASSASEWQDMLSGRLPMREVRAWGKRLAHDGMFRDTLHHIMTDGDSRMAEKCRLGFHVCGCRCFAKPPVTLRRHVDGTRHEYPERNAPPPVAHAHQPFNAPPPFRTDFLDYCLAGMSSSRYPHSVRALCMKLAYKLCRTHPELLEELKLNLEIMEPDLLPPSLRSVRCRVMAGIASQKRG